MIPDGGGVLESWLKSTEPRVLGPSGGRYFHNRIDTNSHVNKKMSFRVFLFFWNPPHQKPGRGSRHLLSEGFILCSTSAFEEARLRISNRIAVEPWDFCRVFMAKPQASFPSPVEGRANRANALAEEGD